MYTLNMHNRFTTPPHISGKQANGVGGEREYILSSPYRAPALLPFIASGRESPARVGKLVSKIKHFSPNFDPRCNGSQYIQISMNACKILENVSYNLETNPAIINRGLNQSNT